MAYRFVVLLILCLTCSSEGQQLSCDAFLACAAKNLKVNEVDVFKTINDQKPGLPVLFGERNENADKCYTALQAASGSKAFKKNANLKRMQKVFFFHNESKSFQEAQTFCQEQQNASLAKIEEMLEKNVVECLINETFNNASGNQPYAWYDRCHGGNSKSCFVIASNGSQDLSCDQAMPFICSKESYNFTGYNSSFDNCTSPPAEHPARTELDTFLGHANLSTATFTLPPVNDNIPPPGGQDAPLVDHGGVKLLRTGRTSSTPIHVAIITFSPIQAMELTLTVDPGLIAPSRGDTVTRGLPPLAYLSVVVVKMSVSVDYFINMNDSTVLADFPIQDEVWYKSAKVECIFLLSDRRISTYGMETLDATSRDYTCKSNHTTTFSALLLVDYIEIPPQLKTLFLVTQSISMLFLLISIVLLMLVRKKLSSNRPYVQINLCFSLLLLHASTVAGGAVEKSGVPCQMMAVITQYFLLSTAFWMLLEGVTLAEKTLGNQLLPVRSTSAVNAARSGVGWGIPGAITGVSAAVGLALGQYVARNPELITPFSGVAEFSECVVGPSPVMYGGVVAPVILVLVANLVILARVSVFVFSKSLKAQEFRTMSQRRGSSSNNLVESHAEHARAALRAALLLFPVFGIPWIFQLIPDESHVMMYVSSVLNGLQGFFLFLVYCVLSSEVRTSARQVWSRSLWSEFKLSSALFSSNQHS